MAGETSSVNLDEFDEIATISRARPCGYAKAREQLSDEDRAAVDQAIVSDYGHRTIARWYKKRDIEVSENHIRRHRAQDCSCPK